MSVHRRSSRRGSRLYELDVLRLAAAISVMCYHFTCADQQLPDQRAAHAFYPELQRYSNYGYMGVDLFFVISGFVILMSAWGRRPGDFALSRFVRLFPCYWLSMAVVLAVFAITGRLWRIPGVNMRPTHDFIPNLTMLQGGIGVPHLDGVYWTLWVELHFYALVALLVWRGLTYRRCLVFMAAWLLLGVYAKEGRSTLLIELLVPKYAPYFVAGMAFFLIHRFGSNPVLWAFVGVCWALRCHYAFEITGSPRAQPGYELVLPCVTTAIFVIMGLVATRRLSWLRWRGLAVLGALTYPLYLLHKVTAIALYHWLGQTLTRWQFLALAVAGSLAVAFLAYALVERPVQQWMRQRLARALESIRQAGAPAAEPRGPVLAKPPGAESASTASTASVVDDPSATDDGSAAGSLPGVAGAQAMQNAERPGEDEDGALLLPVQRDRQPTASP